MFAAASLVAEQGESESNQVSSASSYLWQDLNPATRGLHTVLLNLFSPDDGRNIFTASKDGHFHPTLGLPVFNSSKKSSSLFQIAQTDSPRQWMASLLYLRSVLTLAPESKLRSSNVLEFLSDKQHYDIVVNLAKAIDGHTDINYEFVSSQIPTAMWFLLMPFFGRDQCQVFATKTFGQTLLCNECKLFSALFIAEGEMAKGMNQISNEIAKTAVNDLFTEIDFMLRLCGLSRDVLVSRELDLLPGYSPDVSKNAAGIAIGVFSSLCQHAPLNTPVGNSILERSILSLIRIWIGSSGGYSFDSNISPDDLICHPTLASVAFQGLNDIFKLNNRDKVKATVDGIMPKIFTEFFLPQQDIVASIRYRLLSVFIGSFLLSSTSTNIGLRAQNSFEVASVIEIMNFIDSVYPSIIVSFVKAEDHEAIQMCTAFRMYLLSEAKKMNKEEKRVQKKGLTEFIIGTRQETKRSGQQLARSLVPGVNISTAKLIENAKLLCIKTDVISHVLPQMLLHPSRAPLSFFTKEVCQDELVYTDILREMGLPVLKTLVWELGRDDPEEDQEEEMYKSSLVGNSCPRRKDVRLALSKGYLLREGKDIPKINHMLNKSLSQESTTDVDSVPCPSAAGSWVAPNFMYLMVNIILRQYEKRSERDKFQVVKCLREMLKFLPPEDSPQYMAQIMTSINNAITSTTTVPYKEKEGQISKLHFIAVATLFDYIKIVTSHDASQVGENLTTISVALFPLFDNEHEADPARRRAVEMLEWLASGEADKNLPLYFSEIPFLPFTQDLNKVRTILVQKGVELDDVRLMSQQAGPQEDDGQLKSRFYNRMNVSIVAVYASIRMSQFYHHATNTHERCSHCLDFIKIDYVPRKPKCS